LPFATVQKSFPVAKRATVLLPARNERACPVPDVFSQTRVLGRTEKRLASAGNGELNLKRRERRHSRKYQHRDAEQAEEEKIPDNRLRPDAGSAGSSDAMMEMPGGDVISPHERDHADH
jgi:hypothetical protein